MGGALAQSASGTGKCLNAIDERAKELTAEEERKRAARRAKVEADPALAAAHDKLMAFASPETYPLVEGTYRGHVVVFSHATPDPKPNVGVALVIRGSGEREGETCRRERLVEVEARGRELVAGVRRTLRVGGD